ncbi:MAG: helix-turn-helix transcriptional regulator [Candidatus Omnitrophota bacterium]
MSDLQKFIIEQKKKDAKFAKDFDIGYEEFKIGVVLREARESCGFTQEELARKLHTTKSVISRMENHAEDIKLSTLGKVAVALGTKIKIKIGVHKKKSHAAHAA